MQLIIVGAGVSGLTTGILCLLNQHRVKIIAKSTIDSYDPNDPTFASPKAGAHWSSFASNSDWKLQGYERTSYTMFVSLAKIPGTGCRLMPNYCLYKTKPTHWEVPWYASLVLDYKLMTEFPPGHTFGFTYTTVTMDAVKYTRYLNRVFEKLGGTVQLQSIDSFDSLLKSHYVVFNCAGLGSKVLLNDQSMIPMRGQILLVKANLNYTITIMDEPVTGESTYLIPRDDGTVVFGGTFVNGDERMDPDLAIAKGILSRVSAIDPNVRAIKKLEYVHSVGLRPFRTGGVRVELENKNGSLLIHNYGHGPYGFQTSWGTASAAVNLLQMHLLPSRL